MDTRDPSRVLPLQEHLDKAGLLGRDVLDDLRALAVQLMGKSVLPLIGAGGSVDCGMRLAKDLGEGLLKDYLSDPRYAPHADDLDPDLGDVTEEIFLKAGQLRVVEALGLPDADLWPPAADVGPHFCAYRMLARLARERLFEEAITLNYDCGHEAGLHGEGFLLARDAVPGRAWPDHATVMADARTGSSVADKGSFVLRKIHGCAEHYRAEVARDPRSGAENAIVVRRTQLQNWRAKTWARDRLRQGARESVLLLIGFSAQDPMLVGELTAMLADIYEHTPATGDPRVVVLDYRPNTQPLRTLVHNGLGGAQLADGKVGFIKTAEATTTAALLVLLAETLAHHLRPVFSSVGYVLPDELDARLAALVLAAPVMLRWSYLLRPRQDDHLLQRINLHRAAERGYVPLLADGHTTARALQTRAQLRDALGLTPETTREAQEYHGFVMDATGGRAYLPTGLAADVLAAACRPAGPLEQARRALPSPRVNCVMIGESAGGLRGFSLRTGMEVAVP